MPIVAALADCEGCGPDPAAPPGWLPAAIALTGLVVFAALLVSATVLSRREQWVPAAFVPIGAVALGLGASLGSFVTVGFGGWFAIVERCGCWPTRSPGSRRTWRASRRPRNRVGVGGSHERRRAISSAAIARSRQRLIDGRGRWSCSRSPARRDSRAQEPDRAPPTRPGTPSIGTAPVARSFRRARTVGYPAGLPRYHRCGSDGRGPGRRDEPGAPGAG